MNSETKKIVELYRAKAIELGRELNDKSVTNVPSAKVDGFRSMAVVYSHNQSLSYSNLRDTSKGLLPSQKRCKGIDTSALDRIASKGLLANRKGNSVILRKALKSS
jgi:hypothetical protein